MRFTIGLPIIKSSFLKSTIESILLQTFRDFEVIIQNNAEKELVREEIRNICNSYLNNLRFHYYENDEQINISDNFNLILQKAKGDYFIILSDDDLLVPESLEVFNQLILQYSYCDVFHCRVKVINEKDELVDFTPLCPAYETLPDFMFHRLSGYRQQFLSDFVVSREKLVALGGFPVLPFGWGIDDLTWYLLGDNGIAYSSFIGLMYRVSVNNFSNSRMNYKDSLLKLRDIAFIYKRFSQISQTSVFKSIATVYPDALFKKLLNKAEIKAYGELFRIIGKRTDIFSVLSFYLRNKKEFNLPIEVILISLKEKLFKHS